MNVRSPQILGLFGNLVCGRVPKPESPITTKSQVKKADPQYMGGACLTNRIVVQARPHVNGQDLLCEVLILAVLDDAGLWDRVSAFGIGLERSR